MRLSFAIQPVAGQSHFWMGREDGTQTDRMAGFVRSLHIAAMLNAAATTAAYCHQCCVLFDEVDDRARIGGRGRYAAHPRLESTAGSRRLAILPGVVVWVGESL